MDRTILQSVVALFVTVGSIASAATIDTAYSSVGFNISNSDLLSGLIPSGVGTFAAAPPQDDRDTTGAALTNGTSPASAGTGDTTDRVVVDGGTLLQYTLQPSANGYTISSIDSYSAWGDENRVDQHYVVSFALLGNPNDYSVNPIEVDYAPSGTSGPLAYEVAISGIDLTNVVGVQFDFGNGPFGYVGFRELDVFGSPTAIPEPAAAGMLGLGLAGLVARRRR